MLFLRKKKISVYLLIKKMKHVINLCNTIEQIKEAESYFLKHIKNVKCFKKYKSLEYGLYFTRREVCIILEDLLLQKCEKMGIYLREPVYYEG